MKFWGFVVIFLSSLTVRIFFKASKFFVIEYIRQINQ